MEPNFIAFYDADTDRTQLLISESYLESLPNFTCVAELIVLDEKLDGSWGYDAEDSGSCVTFNDQTGRRYNLSNYRRESLTGNKLDCVSKLIRILDNSPVVVEEESQQRFTEY